MSACVVVGSYNQDHAWHVDRMPQPGETRRGHGFASGPGGKGFNQAVACARQGVTTRFIGALGDDALAAIARDTATAEGVDGRWQCVSGAATGSAGIIIDAGGQNQIVVDLGANEHLDPAFVAAQTDALDGAAVVLAQLEVPVPAVRAALELATARGLLRMLNPAPMHADVDAALLAHVDVLVPNEGEFAQLCRGLLDVALDGEAVATLDDRDLHALARRLRVPTVVVTLGGRGCFVSHGDDHRGDDTVFARLPAEAVQPLDTTAAGDAFCGALAALRAQQPQAPFHTAVRRAGRVAALSTERAGAAASLPRAAEVTARFGA